MASLPFGRTPVPQSRRRPLSLESLESRALLAGVPFSSIPDLVAASDAGTSATDNRTNVSAPTFTGTARNAQSVKIFVGRTEVGTAPVVDGRWSFAHPGFADGRYTVLAQPVGEGGTTGRLTAALPIEIRTAAPATPSLGIVQAGVRPSQAGSAATNLARPVFNGLGPTGGTVEVFVDGSSVGRGVVGNGRQFVVRPAASLASGQRAVTAVASDVFGNRSAAATLALAVDAEAPTVVSIVRTSFDTLTATFSEAVKGVTPGNFRFSGRTSDGFAISSRPLTDGQLRMFVGTITGQLSTDGRTYTLRAPNLDLAAGTFSLTLPKGAVTDLAGNRLANAGTLTVEVEGA